MRVWLWLVLALASFGIARAARTIAESNGKEAVSEPYAPSPSSAVYVSVGYREAFSDLLFVRLRGYFGDREARPESVAELCEAMIELDPKFHRTYEFCAGALTFFALTANKPSQDIYLRALAILERGMDEFPSDWRLPSLAGQIYAQDLVTDDPKQRRAWDEKAAELTEASVRKPGAPAEFQEWASVMRTKLGQRDRAIQGLRELLLLTNSVEAKKHLIARLASLQNQNADAIAGELYEAQHRFETEWHAARPSIPASMYVLLGPRLGRPFDPVELATGGRDLVTPPPVEDPPLE